MIPVKLGMPYSFTIFAEAGFPIKTPISVPFSSFLQGGAESILLSGCTHMPFEIARSIKDSA